MNVSAHSLTVGGCGLTWMLGFTIGFGQRPRLRNIAARDLAALQTELRLADYKSGFLFGYLLQPSGTSHLQPPCIREAVFIPVQQGAILNTN
jgi:hypothetical protein